MMPMTSVIRISIMFTISILICCTTNGLSVREQNTKNTKHLFEHITRKWFLEVKINSGILCCYSIISLSFSLLFHHANKQHLKTFIWIFIMSFKVVSDEKTMMPKEKTKKHNHGLDWNFSWLKKKSLKFFHSSDLVGCSSVFFSQFFFGTLRHIFI